MAPLDPFTFGVAAQVDLTHFFSSAFGWRVLRASYVVSIQRGTRQQLEKDFGVTPTTFVFPEFTDGSAAAGVAIRTVGGEAVSDPNGAFLLTGVREGEQRLVCASPGLVCDENSVDARPGVRRRVTPAVAPVAPR